MRVVIVGGGFVGLQVAKGLGGVEGVQVTLLDAKNHHLFQPLLYQVAMAGLSPAEIAVPLRTVLSRHRNVMVLHDRVCSVDLVGRRVVATHAEHVYDVLVVACGARHSYFGRTEWEAHAPGLKTLSDALEIRRRVLCAFEKAEMEEDPARRRALLTFVVVGGGPTGVELAGAIGEMSRHTLARDFRRIDPRLSRVILLEAGPRILPTFSEDLGARAVRDLESLGVHVWTERAVTGVDSLGVDVGDERIASMTVLWAAGVAASPLSAEFGVECDPQGRAIVAGDLSLPGRREVFVAGDQAHVKGEDGLPLPGIAPVAMQQGRYLAKKIAALAGGQDDTSSFTYTDKGQLATIGRRRAILELGRLKLSGFPAWLAWLLVHVYFLVGFKNRLFVVMQWALAYLTFRRGARLIVSPPPPSEPE